MSLKIFYLVLVALAGASLFAQGDFHKGLSYYKQGNCGKAVEEFEAIVKANPRYEDGFRILGDCYLTLRNYDKAIESFKDALKLKSAHFASYYGLAIASFNSGRFQEAAATLQRGERFIGNFDRYKFYHLRGSALFNSGQYSAAIGDLNEALRVRTTKEDLLQLAQAHREVGNYEEANSAFSRALALDPANRIAQEGLSDVGLKRAAQMIEQRKFNEAISLLSEYVKKNPENGTAFYNLGLSFLFTDRLGEAEEAFSNASRLAPGAAAFDRLGFVQEKRKKYAQAIASYKRAGELGDLRAAENVERVQRRVAQQRAASPK
ncbi:MAG: tetratricopeptide repeat protein [Acidobacteria bacterium]|nr:tetratricopeptide repeat protein [Acidobacteriota bacterium]